MWFWAVLWACASSWDVVDLDGDGYSWLEGDCNDNTPLISPQVEEICDQIDNNCNGVIDEGSAVDARRWFVDVDGDGYAGEDTVLYSCSQPPGYMNDAEDCDDSHSGIHPEATEYCDDIDNNCDGTIDEGDAFDAQTWYGDADNDGYGWASDMQEACDAPSGYVANSQDCDDDDPNINPDANEVNDGVDNDCDDLIDE